MSLMSERERLNRAAMAEGANTEDILRAALIASDERYGTAVREQNTRLDRMIANEERYEKEVLEQNARLDRIEAVLWIRERAKARRYRLILRNWVYVAALSFVGYICYRRGF